MQSPAPLNSPKLVATQAASSPSPISSISGNQIARIEYLFFGVVMVMAVGFLSYKGYRSWLFRYRVRNLERIWQLSVQKKAR